MRATRRSREACRGLRGLRGLPGSRGGGVVIALPREQRRGDDRIRDLADLPGTPVVGWHAWRPGEYAIVIDPCRPHPLRDWPGSRDRQQDVFCERKVILDVGRHHLGIPVLDIDGSGGYSLVVTVAAPPRAGTVAEPGSA